MTSWSSGDEPLSTISILGGYWVGVGEGDGGWEGILRGIGKRLKASIDEDDYALAHIKSIAVVVCWDLLIRQSNQSEYDKDTMTGLSHKNIA